jgi:serine/threonine-protein kinase HipA
MRLAMAVGDKRRYVIDSIVPLHFLQTATRCGASPTVVPEIFDELMDKASTALDATLTSLPSDFPETLANSIADGVRRRLRLLERMAA